MEDPVFERDGSLVTVMRDGHPQSAVHLDDPSVLAFEYVQHLALAVDTLTPAGPLRTTHVGGAGLTLARWLEHTRPGSPQIVLEPDEALTDAVRKEVPLPRRHRIRVRPVDGLTGIVDLRDGSADLVVVDAFDGGRVPAELVTSSWFAEVARVLGPRGLLLANLPDEPGMRWVTRVAAGVAATLGRPALLGLHEVLKGRRFGNLVLVASPGPLDLYALRRGAASAALPTGVLVGDELARKVTGATPFTPEDTRPSPEPPSRGGWRRR